MGTHDETVGAARAASLVALSSGIQNAPDFFEVRRLIEDVFRANGQAPPAITQQVVPELVRIPDLYPRYLQRLAGSKSHRGLVQRALLSFSRAFRSLEVRSIIGQHVQDWIDQLLADGRASGTVLNWLAALSKFFDYARGMGHTTINPCDGVVPPEYVPVVDRLPMEETEVSKLLLHLQATGSADWLTFTLLGRHAGLRLQDAAKVVGEAVSFLGQACLVDVTAGKTLKPDVLPLFGPVVPRLREIRRPGPLMPSLVNLSSYGLCRGFLRLCDGAGVDPKLVTIGGRNWRRVSFHSLRHAFVTDLSRRGIPQDLRKKMSAHVTDEAHEKYDHAGALALWQKVASYFDESQR